LKKRLGQYFIFDRNMLNKILNCSDVTTNDTVIEIGPGLGTLTNIMADRVKKVIAIEYDKKLINKLKENIYPKSNIEIITADALKFPYESIRGKVKVIANIPYYITTPLLFRLLEYKEKITAMTLLLQKEVAKRIVASPGNKDYGVLSISTQLYTRPSLRFIVTRKVFVPPPDVDSAVVHFEVSPVPLYKISDLSLFNDIVKTAFSQRRKTIINGLKKIGGIENILQKTGIDPKLRPENLSIDDFARLSEAINLHYS